MDTSYKLIIKDKKIIIINSFHALTYLSFNKVSKGTNDDDLGQIKYEHFKCDNLNMYSGIKFKT